MKRSGLIAGVAIVLSVALVALLAPWLSPQSPNAFNLPLRLLGPSFDHPCGLDEEGRDLLSLVLWGARVSLVVSFLTVLCSGVAGVVIGLTAGYFGGVWDGVFTFVTDIV